MLRNVTNHPSGLIAPKQHKMPPNFAYFGHDSLPPSPTLAGPGWSRLGVVGTQTLMRMGSNITFMAVAVGIMGPVILTMVIH